MDVAAGMPVLHVIIPHIIFLVPLSTAEIPNNFTDLRPDPKMASESYSFIVNSERACHPSSKGVMKCPIDINVFRVRRRQTDELPSFDSEV